MKFWKEKKGELVLNGSEGRIVSVNTFFENHFTFYEECDQFFNEAYTKEEALQIVEELKQWIINN